MAIRAPTVRRYSIAQARHNLAALVHDVERLGPVEVTRRGQTVAMLVAAEDYERLRGRGPSFWDALQRFRRDHALVDIDTGFWNDLRDRSPGRKVRL